ncbi:MAG: D-glycero-alpha-D-manno-heptose-1,7-bisphosphate 7-phosphatase [bacterium]
MKVVFLDRDGVINQRLIGDYVKTWAEFRFIPYAKRAIRKLTEAGYQIHIVSNQQGVGKGLMSKPDLDLVTNRMLAEIKKSGGKITSTAYCIHTESDKCSCRKPKPGLLLGTAKKYKFKPSACWMVGDGERDIIAGTAAGCKTILIGNIRLASSKPDYRVSTLLAAANLILNLDAQ